MGHAERGDFPIAEMRGNKNAANAVVAEALATLAVESVRGYDSIRREVPYGEASRVDFLLEGAAKPPCYLEVKSVTMSRETGLAEFPDSVTARGTKHLHELAAAVEGGARAVLLFLLQRGDCAQVGIAGDIDPAYKTAVSRCRAASRESRSSTPKAMWLDQRGRPRPRHRRRRWTRWGAMKSVWATRSGTVRQRQSRPC